MREHLRSHGVGHVAAAGATAAAALLRLALTPWLGGEAPLILFVLAVVVAGYHSGLRSGLAATLLSALAGASLFLEPTPSLAVARPTDRMRLAVFVIEGALVSWLCEAMHAARRRAEASRQDAIAQREAAERRATDLGESETRFRGTFEQAAVGIAHVDLSGRWLRVNRRLCEIVGYACDRLLSLTFQDITYPPDLGTDLDLLRRLVAGEIPTYSMEKRYVRGDGSVVWVNLTVSLVRDAAATPQFFISVIEDISERKRAEESLRESEERYRLLSEALPHMVWTMRPDRSLEYFNRRWTEFTGLTPERMTDGGWASLAHPDDRDAFSASVEGPFSRGEPHEAEFRFRRHDGEYRHVVSRVVPVKDEAGAVVQWVGSTTDVEDRWRAEQSLRESEDRYRRLAADLEVRVADRTAALQEANAALEAFGYSVSHDLRAPLRAMQSLAAVLVEDYADRLDDHGREFARRIAASAAGMDRQILDLLEYSRLSRADLSPTPVGLDGVVGEAVERLDGDLRDAELTVQRPLPAVLGHRPTLVQILSNLLSNAAKFVLPGVKVQVRVWAERHGGRVRLWVEDDGIGIAPRHRDRIFRVFERLHGPETYPGTGIGLAIVRKGAERMGGTAGAESEVGKGSRFWVELPGAGPPGGEAES